jgi:hypothetical protein
MSRRHFFFFSPPSSDLVKDPEIDLVMILTADEYHVSFLSPCLACFISFSPVLHLVLPFPLFLFLLTNVPSILAGFSSSRGG